MLDSEQCRHLMHDGRVMWSCGHVELWRGVDVALSWFTSRSLPPDVAAWPCPECGAVGILGTIEPHERSSIPRAPLTRTAPRTRTLAG